MYAIVVRVTLKEGRWDDVAKSLQEEIIPGVKRAQGFKGGYWARSEDGAHGVSFELFDTAEDARAELDRRSMEVPAEAPLTIDSAGLFEVVGSA